MTSERPSREGKKGTEGTVGGRSRGGVEDGKKRVMGNINKASKNSSQGKKVRICWMDFL